jgi:hypothetical protein
MTARIVSKGLLIVPVIFIAASLTLVFYSATATSAPAPHSTYYNDRCASCHTDDDATCNGCHKHGNRSLTATPDKSSYAPGELMNISFSGGSKTGWIRGMLVDHNNTEVDRKTGPTFTGNDGGTLVKFPLAFNAYAPGKAGTYNYIAQYYGNNDGNGHGAIDVPFTINVGSTADLTVNVIPAASPMIFGPQGGAIRFRVDLNNTTSSPVPFDGWIDVTMPSGMNFGPVLGPLHLTLPGGGSISKLLSLNLPGMAPTGVYSLNVYIDDFSVGSTFDIDSFTFIKEP